MSSHRENSRLSDRLRLILLLDACELADLAPVPVARLHAFAFLANVLAPIWSEESYDGKILKRKGGPYYPELQRELDCLVGLGVVDVYGVDYVPDVQGYRLIGEFALNDTRAAPIIEFARKYSMERLTSGFFQKLSIAAARLDRPLEEIVKFDVTWSDNRTGTGDVVDFSEYQRANYSASAADFFDELVPGEMKVSRGDKLQMYLRLLERRANVA